MRERNLKIELYNYIRGFVFLRLKFEGNDRGFLFLILFFLFLLIIKNRKKRRLLIKKNLIFCKLNFYMKLKFFKK